MKNMKSKVVVHILSSNIRFLRKKENLSQEEFAERFGVSRQSVAKWENGDSLPDVGKCVEIADYYEISVDVLLRIPLEEHDVGKETSEGKYIFGMAKVGERGQVVIPKYAREVFDIHPGDRLMVMGDVAKGGLAFAKISFGSLFGKDKK